MNPHGADLTPATLSGMLARFASRLRIEDLPAEVVDVTSRRVLDTLGVCVASSGMPYARAVLETVLEESPGGSCTLLATGHRTSPSMAALYNGSLAHGNDYDDTHSKALMHLSGVIVPAALAMCESAALSGARMIESLVAGYETGLRIGMAAPSEFHARGFHATGVCGVFAAAVTAARALGLDAEQTTHAMGIAGSQAAGSLEFLSEGASTKRMHPGWAAHAGIIAAQLARRGFTGPSQILEGRFGLYRSYGAVTPPSMQRMAAQLGQNWEVLEVDFKPYPCGHISHPYMDCALALRREHGIAPADIASIEVRLPTAAVPILCEPAAVKVRPANGYAARFSLAFSLALILIDGRAEIADFSDERVREPALLALCDRFRYVVDDSLPYPSTFPGHVSITLHDGTVLEKRMEASRGSREHPMTDAELRGKFASNCAAAYSQKRIDAIWDMGEALASLADAGALARAMAG